MAELVALWADALAALPEGTKTAFAWIPRPPAVALDLAIQAAGLVSVPVTDPGQAALRGATVWADPGGSSAPGALESLSLPSPRGVRDLAFPERPAGGAIVGAQTISQELSNAADRIQDAIAPGRGREIAVLGGSPEHWPNRVLLAWATIQGAALLLAPTPDSLVSSAVWARATLFLGTAAEVASLRQAVERERPPFWARKQGRLPFGRLRTVLWSGAVEPSPEQVGFWMSRGVLTLRCPDLPLGLY